MCFVFTVEGEKGKKKIRQKIKKEHTLTFSEQKVKAQNETFAQVFK